MLRLRSDHRRALIDDAVDKLPNETCGLLAGKLGDDRVEAVYPCRNLDASPFVYTLDPLDHLRASRDAERHGWEIVGVYHSHTHTEGYPSPTDVAKAPDPDWHYVLVSLRDDEPVVRSFHIVDEVISEEEVVPEEVQEASVGTDG